MSMSRDKQQSRFEKLAARLRPRLVAQALRITSDPDEADDVAQDTLLRLWDMRGRLDAYDSVEALAMVMGRNLALTVLRQKRPTSPLDAPGLAIPDTVPAPDAGLIADETATELDRVMAMLSPGQQAVLRMKHADGLEIADIARMTGSTENNVRVLLCRARARVRELFMKNQQL